MTAPTEKAPRLSAAMLIFIALLGAVVLWSYWPTLAKLALRWSEDPQYSHGYLVPAFSGYLLWLRRDRVQHDSFRANWLGLVLLGVAVALRLAGARFHFEYFDQISLVPACASLFLLAAGWRVFFWSLPGVLFLAFMIPLPHSVSLAMSGPMQAFATAVSTFLLQTMGKPALAEGNVILLNEIELGIVEACSGLRMLVVFFALSTAVAMLIRKPLWEKLLIGLSAIPIALASNILRIVVTGLFYDAFGNHFGGAFFHDLAGWLMMPLGLVFLGVELAILKHLLVESSGGSPVAGQVAPQRMGISAISLYEGGTKSRREKPVVKPEPKPEPEPEPEAVEVNA